MRTAAVTRDGTEGFWTVKINHELEPGDLAVKIAKLWEASGRALRCIEETYDASQGSPVFTAAGTYTARGWTEWTQGFQYGSALLQFDATG